MDDDTQTHSVYLRSQMRLGAGSRVLGEVGYRVAPETGYIRELDNVTYFSLRASYSFPVARPVTLSAFARGEFGKNRDFQQISETSGVNPDRDFDRDHYGYGVTLTGQPSDDVTLFGSFFQDRDSQDFDLVRSNLPRFLEPTGAPVNFYTDSPLDYRADLTNLIVGGHTRFTDHTDGSLSFSYTQSKSRFERDNPTSTTLYPASLVESDIYIVDFTIGHWFVEGLRVSTGYRFQAYRDHTPLPSGLGSEVAPFDLSTNEHTMTLGLTLTSDFFDTR
jgi:hypothetical protein